LREQLMLGDQLGRRGGVEGRVPERGFLDAALGGQRDRGALGRLVDPVAAHEEVRARRLIGVVRVTELPASPECRRQFGGDVAAKADGYLLAGVIAIRCSDKDGSPDSIVEPNIGTGVELPEDRCDNEVLVAVDEVTDALVVEPLVYPF